MQFLEFEIPVRSWNSEQREILAAKLSLIGFEGFIDDEHVLQAYILEDAFSSGSLNDLIDEFSELGIALQYRFHRTPEQNWNEEWEKQYEPVVLREKLLIRAPFHDAGSDLLLTLVIEPKMSFGTGHHFTTRLMLETMLDLDFAGRSVLDMGCGTGVLGILASKLGAEHVLGVDNDQWAFENAIENTERNGVGNMTVKLGDSGVLGNEAFDYILANITRNILVRDMHVFAGHMKPGGMLVVSGFLSEDVQYVLNSAYESRLDHIDTSEIDNWISLIFLKSAGTERA